MKNLLYAFIILILFLVVTEFGHALTVELFNTKTTLAESQISALALYVFYYLQNEK